MTMKKIMMKTMMMRTMMKTLTGASQYSVCTPEQPHPKARCTENIAPAILHSQLPSNFEQSWKKVGTFFGRNSEIWRQKLQLVVQSFSLEK